MSHQRRTLARVRAEQVRIGQAILLAGSDNRSAVVPVTSVRQRRGWTELGTQGSPVLAVRSDAIVEVLSD